MKICSCSMPWSKRETENVSVPTVLDFRRDKHPSSSWGLQKRTAARMYIRLCQVTRRKNAHWNLHLVLLCIGSESHTVDGFFPFISNISLLFRFIDVFLFSSVSISSYCDVSISFPFLYSSSLHVVDQCPAFHFLSSIHVTCLCLCLHFSLSFHQSDEFEQQQKNSHEFLENLSNSYLISFFSFSRCCRWTMDEMQVEYLKPTRNISVGIYGWRKRCLYGLLIVLTLVVLINLCLTFWLSVALGLHWVRWEKACCLDQYSFSSLGKYRTDFNL